MPKAKQENLISRPPIVVVMGHIDHGKTALLDQIRKTHVMEKESGGITQHIGAYQAVFNNKKITFLDTPGHEAFSQMRSRGAKVADIALLVIDAGEGIKAQTKEVISHIKKAEIPIVVVMNKMDKPEADPERVKRELVKEEIMTESLGGHVPVVETSAQTGKGITELLEMIILMSEMDKLSADPKNPAKGVVIESFKDNFRGSTATLLLLEGTLRVGEIIATPSAFTKIKSLEDFQGKPIKEALPSDPVIVFGFNQVPRVGEEFKVFSDADAAEQYAKTAKPRQAPIDNIETDESELQKTLNIVLKADVVGSLEAIEEILSNIPQGKVSLKILKAEVGNISESDMKLVKGGRGLILGFRVKVDTIAKRIMEREKVRVMNFDIIYELVEEVRNLMERNVAAESVRNDIGKLKVLMKFLAEKNRQIIGGKVIEGEVRRGALIEVWRNEENLGEGRMVNLQKNKKDADSASKGQECGILFEGNIKIEEGDILNFYTREKKQGTL